MKTQEERDAFLEKYPIADPNGVNMSVRTFASEAGYYEVLNIQEYLKKYTSFTKETIKSEYRYFRDEIRKSNLDDAQKAKLLEKYQFAMGGHFVDLVLPKTLVEMDPIELCNLC